MRCGSSRNIADFPAGLNRETPFSQAFQYFARLATTFSWSFRKRLLDHDFSMKSARSIHSVSKQSLSFRTWRNHRTPSRILVIRLHAIGDVAITFPSCSALREQLPHTQIDFLTSETCVGLPNAIELFNHVFVFPQCESRPQRLLETALWCLKVRKFSYDIIVDLQSNWISRAIRRAAFPECWGEFDRFEPKPAGDRVVETFHRLGFDQLKPVYRIELKEAIRDRSRKLLLSHGWDEGTKLIGLNPAGLWKTRNWPIENYEKLARTWLKKEQVQFVMLGTGRILSQGDFLERQLRTSFINLVGKTSLEDAMGILQFSSGMISEDSGLMHMAWVSGIPTLALFGSSRHDWSKPLGKHSVCLHSGDLECGACMESTCRYAMCTA